MSSEPKMRYFIYSKEELKQRTEIEAKLGKKFIIGTLIDHGKPKQYTQKVASLDNIRYSDYRIIAYLDINTAKFTDPYAE